VGVRASWIGYLFMKKQPTTSVNSNENLPVDLKDMTTTLGYTQPSKLRDRFVSYCKLVESSQSTRCFAEYIYKDPKSHRNTFSFTMTVAMAKGFAMYVDPVIGQDYTNQQEAKAAQAEALKIELLEAKIAKLTHQKAKNYDTENFASARVLLNPKKDQITAAFDHISARVNYREFVSITFDRELYKGYRPDIFKTKGTSILINPAHNNKF